MSIKGNHDYGIYYRWANQNEQVRDQLLLDQYHRELGFDLLKNENRTLTKGNESISVVGVENWGLPPFPQVGDLNQALKGVEDVPRGANLETVWPGAEAAIRKALKIAPSGA